MALKKKLTEAQLKKEKADNAIVYKVVIAMALMCLCVMGLRRLRAYYSSWGGIQVLFDKIPIFTIIGAALAVVSLVLLIVLRKKVIRMVCPWTLAAGAFVALVGFTMQHTMTDQFPLLYFVCAAGFILYIIFQLYRWEFFLMSFTTLITGGGFFAFSRGYSLAGDGKWILLVLVIVWILTTACAFLASRNKGRIVLGKINYPMFSSRFTPVLLYVVNGLWVVCTIVGLVFGSLFSYYCMFVAIAVEFIAAVYYTFQLK